MILPDDTIDMPEREITEQDKIEALFDAVDEGTDLFSVHLEGNTVKIYFKDYRSGTRKNVYVVIPIADARIEYE